MVTLLSAFCLILLGVLITISAERDHWKKQCELLQHEKESKPVAPPEPEPVKPKPDPKPKKDNREYFLITDKKCGQSDSLINWYSSSDL